jgi:membrane protein DedA with SNARE-associated domain
MHILLGLDISLYILLFVVAGASGLLVRIDQWVEGDFSHPTTDAGKIDLFKSFWSYILTFILSGLAGMMVAIGTGYLLENRDTNIFIFTALMIGAIGKLIFYKLVEWVHTKFEDNISSKSSLRKSGARRRK